MARIKAYIGMNERRGVHYYQQFNIIDKLPEVGEEYGIDEIVRSIHEVSLDCEQGNDEVYEYDYYDIITRDNEGGNYNHFVAIKKEEE